MFHALQIRAEGASPPSVRLGLAHRPDETTSSFQRFLGISPSPDALRCATLALVNVASQLPEPASPFPLGLRNTATTFSWLGGPQGPEEQERVEFVGVAEHSVNSPHDEHQREIEAVEAQGVSEILRDCFMTDTPDGFVEIGNETPHNSPAGEEAMSLRLEPAASQAPPPAPRRAPVEPGAQGERRGNGGPAQARAREVNRRITDVPPPPLFDRPSQNVAAAVALFLQLPAPETPEDRRRTDKSVRCSNERPYNRLRARHTAPHLADPGVVSKPRGNPRVEESSERA